MGRMNSRSGMTLIEVLISASVAAVLMGGVVRSMQTATGLLKSTSTVLDVDRKARKLTQNLRAALENARGSTLNPELPEPDIGAPTPFVTDIEFQAVTGWSAGGVTLSPVQRLFVRIEATEQDNGLDDDGDGLIDEMELVHVPDVASGSNVELILARGVLENFVGENGNLIDDNNNGLVDEPGFSITEDNGRLTVRVALGEVDEEGTEHVRSTQFELRTQP